VSTLYVGLMSGTSMDGVDAVLVDFSRPKPLVAGYLSAQLAPDLRAELFALNSPGHNELHRAALAANALASNYAQVVNDLLAQCGVAREDVAAIGAHGQTLRHRPGEFDGAGYTLQLNNPALLAELTGVDVVADFRSRDLAAGGQGAPLVPAFHQAMFGRAGQAVAVLNIGGISNISLLDGAGGEDNIIGFDCGPGNVLLDLWCQRHTGQAFDKDGAWGASGRVIPSLLAAMCTEPYFAKAPPKSTGRDLFHAAWLDAHLSAHAPLQAQDVQATLAELTVSRCIDCVTRYEKSSNLKPVQVLVCGGGAYNQLLMRRLQALLPHTPVQSTEAEGLAPLQVEAAAFAWLARQCIERQPGNLASVTGARGARVLGAVYPR
jgi:anhydro-N-acetylmuramic acid kinase